MPIYEFKCKKCGKHFERIVFKPLNEVEVICPNCESKEIEKQISAPGSVGVSEKSAVSSAPSCSAGCCGCPSKFD